MEPPLCSVHHPSAISFPLGSNVLHSTLFSDTLNSGTLYGSHNAGAICEGLCTGGPCC